MKTIACILQAHTVIPLLIPSDISDTTNFRKKNLIEKAPKEGL